MSIKNEDVISPLGTIRSDDETVTRENNLELIAAKLTRQECPIRRTKIDEIALGDYIDIRSRLSWTALRGGTTSASWRGFDLRLWLRSVILSRRIRRDQGMSDQRTRTEIL